MTLNPARARMVEKGNVLISHGHQIAYSEGADRAEIWNLTWDQALTRLAAGETLTGDCSSSAEAVAKWAGCPLGPLGYTGTELQIMPHIALADALPGDFIIFGTGTGTHATFILKADATNPTLFSHGYAGFCGPITLQNEWANHRGQPITVCSIAKFLPTPPPIPPEDVMAVAATVDKDGKVHVFQETKDGKVYGSTQKTPGGPYGTPFVVMQNGKAA